ncbi:MAG TPA: HAMP domain-containing protein, partial [Puia sp.]|nr:HAMP domain-containing protein [Puia sp.]
MKIRLKLTLLFSALFAALLLVFALSIYFSNARDREEQYYARLHQQAVTKANLLLGAKVQPAVLQLIYKNSLNAFPLEEVAVYDTAFHLLYHDAVYIDRVKETRGMIDTIVRQHEIRFYVGDLQAIGFLYPFGGKDYVITAAAKDIDGLARLYDLRIAVIVGFVVAILLTFVAGSLFSRQALQPVSRMVDKVEEITASRLDLRISEAKGKDEIAELASTFNRMLDRLENSFEAQKQFVSHISHEVRTPMATIIGELEIAAKKGRTNAEYEEMNARLLIDARRVVRLAGGLLDLARASYDKAEIAFRPVRLDELLVDTRNAVLKSNPEYRVDIVFEREIEDDRHISLE